jgi:hypothetical protein
MNIPALIRSVGFSGREWVFFALILAATTVSIPSWPDGGVPKTFFIYVLAGFAALQVAYYRGFDKLDGMIALTAVYAASSGLWAVDSFGAMGAGINWLAMALIIMAARRLPSDKPILAAIAVAAVIALISNLFMPNYHAGFGNENYATWWFVAAFPFLIAGFYEWPRVASMLIAAVSVYILFYNEAHVEAVAISAWFAFGGLSVGKRPRLLFLTIGALLAFAILANLQMPSITNRLELWDAGINIWLAYPILGAGLGGFDTLFGLMADSKTFINHDVQAAGAAHNDALQVATDLGIVGCLLVATTLWMALKSRSGWPVWSIIGLGALAFVDFPLQNPAVALAGGLAFARLGPLSVTRGRLGFSALSAPLAAFFVTAGSFMAQAQVEYAKTGALFNTNPIVAHMMNERAVYHWPFDKRSRRELIRTALKSGVDDRAVERAILTARSAYKGNNEIERLITAYRKAKENG